MSLENLLGSVSDPLEQRWLQKFGDQVQQVETQNKELITNFLDPRQQQLASMVIKNFPELNHQVFGGYPGAERARVFVWPASWGNKEFPPVISCLSIEGNFRFTRVKHRDFLGSILSLGLRREMVGDILLVGEDVSAQVLIDKQMADYVCANLHSVHNVRVQIREIPLTDVESITEKVKIIKGTVPSMRLDAIASLGFGYSRSKIAPLIKGEHVKVNWQPVKNPSLQVKENDIISLHGKGRVKIAALEGESRKGRIRLQLKKYL